MVLRGRVAPQLVRKLWVAYFFFCLMNWVTVFSKCLASVLWLARPPLSCPTAQKVCFCSPSTAGTTKKPKEQESTVFRTGLGFIPVGI